MTPDPLPPDRDPNATGRPRPEPTDFLLDPDELEDRSATGEYPVLPATGNTVTADGTSRADGSSDDVLRLSVPGYEILRELGRGGMGVVYLARQIDLNRPVALKMILSGEHAGPAERDRFRRQAEAVAALQHPNIVQIFEVGEAAGRPYLAFEYVSGGNLAGVLDGQPWPARAAADLIEALARAVHFAHTRGVVHRDLKPANVLLGDADTAPRPGDRRAREDPLFRVPAAALRTPKITDFGLAKRVDPKASQPSEQERTAQTRTGAVVGTPSYLAPEQAAGKNRQVGPATDVHALGAILYELLTGRPPFRGETALDTVLQVMADDPVPPSRLRAKLPRDLETVCLKCLQKDPRKRYASAADLADDLHRFVAGEPIAARPVGRIERLDKWVRRHPAASVLIATTALALLFVLAVSIYFNVQLQTAAEDLEKQRTDARDAQGRAQLEKFKADAEKEEAEKQKADAIRSRQEVEAKKAEAERGVYALQLFKAAALGERDPQRATRLLEDRDRCPDRLRDFTWRYIHGQCRVTEQVVGVQQNSAPVARLDLSPDGKWAATVSGVDPLVRVWDVANRRLAFVLAGHTAAARAVAFAPDGRTIATGGADKAVCIWELPAGAAKGPVPQLAPKFTLIGHTGPVNAIDFNATDSRRLASAADDGTVRLWEVPPAEPGKPRAKPTATGVLSNHVGPVTAVAWATDNLYSGGADGRVVDWQLSPDGGTGHELFKVRKQVLALAVTPDAELLAAAGDTEPDEDEPVIRLFHPITNRDAGKLQGHTGLAVRDLAFADEGRRLVSAGADGTVRVWDVAGRQERAVFRPGRGTGPESATRGFNAVRFGPDGLSVISGGQDGAVRAWGFSGQKEEAVTLDVKAPLGSAVLSADGSTLAVAERLPKQVKVWALGDPDRPLDPKPTRTLTGLTHPPAQIAVNADGSLVAAATAGGAFVWHRGADDRPQQVHKGPVAAIALRGSEIVIAVADGHMLWLDLATGRPRHPLGQVVGTPSLVVFSPDGRKLITTSGTALQVWDADSGELLFEQRMAHFIHRITAVAVRPGDTRGPWEMASADDGGLVQVWEFEPHPDADPILGESPLTVRQRPAPPGLADQVGALAFTADGRTLASGGVDRAVRLRDPETGQERAALAGHTDTVLLVAFRADRVMLSVGREGTARVWRAAQ